LSSEKLVKVKINDNDNIQQEIDGIFKKVFSAAVDSITVASDYHLRRAISNVENAYTTAGYPKVSYMYMRWLAAKHPSFKKTLPDDWEWTNTSDVDLNALADTLYSGKTSMISGLKGGMKGMSLLEGLQKDQFNESKTSAWIRVVSMAKYSKDLEYGYLFGKYRGAGKKRPFFTGHILTTQAKLRDEFKNKIGAMK